MTSKQNFYETTGSRCQYGHATPKILWVFQDTGKSCQKENHTLLHRVSSPWRTFTQESPWRTSPTTSQGTHLASKNSEKKSVLSKTAPKQSQGGKNARWSAGFPYHTDWIQLAPLRLFTETLEISSYIANVILNQSSVSSTKGLSHSSLTWNSHLTGV